MAQQLNEEERIAEQSARVELEHLSAEAQRRVLLAIAERLGVSLEPDSDFSVGQ
jgi:uncharacterized protein (DUF934 family)